MGLPHSQREFEMSSLLSIRFALSRRACLLAACTLLIPSPAEKASAQETSIAVRSELQQELSLTLADLKAMPSFLIRDVPIIPERVGDGKDEEKVIQKTLRGVFLRDVLWKAGLKHKRKWEPGVFIQIRNKDGREIVFSFGASFSTRAWATRLSLPLSKTASRCQRQMDSPCP